MLELLLELLLVGGRAGGTDVGITRVGWMKTPWWSPLSPLKVWRYAGREGGLRGVRATTEVGRRGTRGKRRSVGWAWRVPLLLVELGWEVGRVGCLWMLMLWWPVKR